MNEKNLKNWLAITKEGKYITIDKAEDNKQNYYCPCCNEVLRAKALQSNLITPHFYHLQNDNLNSCNYENAYRRYWKENLISLGEIITIPFLNNITCIELKTDHKINNNLVADIYIKTLDNKEVLILFDRSNINFKNYNYDVFCLNFLQLDFNKSNLNSCIECLYSIEVKQILDDLKDIITKKKQNIDISIKEVATKVNIDINNIENVKSELIQYRFYKEAELINDVLILLDNRKSNFYRYKGQDITEEEFNNLNELISKILKITKFNIDISINTIKRIDFNIYKTKWNKSLYFDFIKPISASLKDIINKLESIF